MNIIINKNPLPTRKQKNAANLIENQYHNIFGKKEAYSDNEIFVFNAMRSAQKILERYEN